MADSEFPEKVKKFIFEFVDSVELLDVLLLMSSDPSKSWNANKLSRELRTNVNSIESRLSFLKKIALIDASDSANDEFQFKPKDQALEQTVAELAAVYAAKKHRVLQLIFSPMKQARDIADGFRVSTKKPNDGNTDG